MQSLSFLIYKARGWVEMIPAAPSCSASLGFSGVDERASLEGKTPGVGR